MNIRIKVLGRNQIIPRAGISLQRALPDQQKQGTDQKAPNTYCFPAIGEMYSSNQNVADNFVAVKINLNVI